MKRILGLIIFALFPVLATAQKNPLQEGTIVRMRMTECLGRQHGFIATMSGGGRMETGAQCPEYVLVAGQVVYVISGRTSDTVIPLAEVTRFHLQKNEMLIRIDDAPRETRFSIQQMVLRSEWEAVQQHVNNQISPSGATDVTVSLRGRD